MHPHHDQQSQQGPYGPPAQPWQETSQTAGPPRQPYLPPRQAPRRAEKKKPRWLIAAAVVGVLALGGAILQLVDGDEEPATTAAASPAASTGVPTPDAGQRAAYLAALQEIDPGLAANEERAIRRGRAVCDRIIHPRENPSVEEYTVAALSGGTTTIDQAQARQVIEAVKAWCR